MNGREFSPSHSPLPDPCHIRGRWPVEHRPQSLRSLDRVLDQVLTPLLMMARQNILTLREPIHSPDSGVPPLIMLKESFSVLILIWFLQAESFGRFAVSFRMASR